MREDTLLGAALLLVATRAAEGRVELAGVESLSQGLGLHHLGMDLAARGDWRYAARDAVGVDVNAKVEAEPLRRIVAKGDHLSKFPGRIDMQQRKWQRRGVEGLERDMQHRARVLADRIEHDRIAEFGDDLPHYVNSFRLKAFQVRRQGVRHGIRFGLNSLRAGERKAHRSRRIGGAAGSYAGTGRSGQGA